MLIFCRGLNFTTSLYIGINTKKNLRYFCYKIITETFKTLLEVSRRNQIVILQLIVNIVSQKEIHAWTCGFYFRNKANLIWLCSQSFLTTSLLKAVTPKLSVIELMCGSGILFCLACWREANFSLQKLTTNCHKSPFGLWNK